MSDGERSAESGRVYGGESAADRLARQRQQFLDAGLELFGSVGYRATTVRMLCKQAGLIDRYFYKTFASTEDLLEATYRAAMDRIEAEVMTAISAPNGPRDPQSMIEAGLEAFFVAIEDSRVARVCWVEVLGVSPRIDALYKQRIQQFASLLQALARGLYPAWNASDEEAQLTAIAAIGAISQSAMHWLMTDYKARRATLVKVCTLLLTRFVVTLPQT